MSESFRQAMGRKVVSRSSAKELGAVGHLLVEAQQRQIAAVVIGKGKKARLVDWAQLSGFGPGRRHGGRRRHPPSSKR